MTDTPTTPTLSEKYLAEARDHEARAHAETRPYWQYIHLERAKWCYKMAELAKGKG